MDKPARHREPGDDDDITEEGVLVTPKVDPADEYTARVAALLSRRAE